MCLQSRLQVNTSFTHINLVQPLHLQHLAIEVLSQKMLHDPLAIRARRDEVAPCGGGQAGWGGQAGKGEGGFAHHAIIIRIP